MTVRGRNASIHISFCPSNLTAPNQRYQPPFVVPGNRLAYGRLRKEWQAKNRLDARPEGLIAKRQPSPGGLGINSEDDLSAVGAALHLDPLSIGSVRLDGQKETPGSCTRSTGGMTISFKTRCPHSYRTSPGSRMRHLLLVGLWLKLARLVFLSVVQVDSQLCSAVRIVIAAGPSKIIPGPFHKGFDSCAG